MLLLIRQYQYIIFALCQYNQPYLPVIYKYKDSIIIQYKRISPPNIFKELLILDITTLKQTNAIDINPQNSFGKSTPSLNTCQNYHIINHYRSKYLLIYLSPFLILGLVVILQSWTDQNFTWENGNPQQYYLQQIPKCYGEQCQTIGYIVSGKRQPYIDYVLEYIGQENNLNLKKDIKQLKFTKEQIMNELHRNPNKTQAIIIFCTDSKWKISEQVYIPCYADDYHMNFYTILYNISLNHRSPYMGNLKEAYPKDLVTLKLKSDIDTAIVQYYHEIQTSPRTSKTSLLLQNKFIDFPNRTSRFIQGVSLFSNYGSFFIMIPYLILLVLQSSHLLHQKQRRLRIGLNIVGVTHFQYYLSQLLVYGVSVAIISMNFILSGWVFQNKFFINSIQWFTFITLFINGFVLGLIAFNVMALVNYKSLGMSLTYGFILYSISMQWIFSGGFILELLYLDSATTVIKLIKLFFNLYPSFHFSKIFTNISRKADNHMDTFQNRYVNGTSFNYDDLFQRAEQHYEKPFPHGYIMPSPVESFFYLILTSLIYILSLWIFDVFIESNRGYKQKLFSSSKNRKRSIYQAESVQEQEQPIVQITNLQKTYNNEVYALRGISMELRKGEIVGLLGENGAGKSTLINILIGALTKSNGSVLIDGKDIQTDIVAIRKIIGVCPQFDILWEEMTAYQHVEMFFKLKGFQASEKNIKKSLQSVNLYSNRNGKVSTFSGGMRRRLSLAISLIGDPKLVILDEPTTGMDAHIRLLTWKLILKIKQNRTVLITTHNMQQAECLSDTINIMTKGKLVVSGNSVDLKKKYGQGYIIKGFNKQTNQQVEWKCTDQQLAQVLEKIGKMNLENWSLRQTTLQEVFLNVNERF